MEWSEYFPTGFPVLSCSPQQCILVNWHFKTAHTVKLFELCDGLESFPKYPLPYAHPITL